MKLALPLSESYSPLAVQTQFSFARAITTGQTEDFRQCFILYKPGFLRQY